MKDARSIKKFYEKKNELTVWYQLLWFAAYLYFSKENDNLYDLTKIDDTSKYLQGLNTNEQIYKANNIFKQNLNNTIKSVKRKIEFDDKIDEKEK